MNTLAVVAIKVTLLFGAAFVLAFAFRKTSAATRHFLWALTFAACLVLPFSAYVATPESSLRIPIPVASENRLSSSATPARPAMAPSTSVRSRPKLDLETLWLLGFALFSSRLALGVVLSGLARRRAHEVLDSDWRDLLDAARERLGVERAVGLKRGDRCQMPMTVGLFQPTILLPEASADYSPPRRWAVLLHELAHVRRRDCLIQLLSQLGCALYWWHPLSWIGARKMRLLSEQASDDLVLAAGAEPADYAHDLLDMAKSLHKERATPLASVTMAHRSRFEERLIAILDPDLSRGAVSLRFGLGVATVTLAVSMALALATPTVASRAVTHQQAQQGPQQETETRARAREALASALDDPEPSVRKEALHALVQMGDEAAAPHLESALESEDPEIRAEAAWGLGQMQRQEAAGALASALSDADEEVREQAAWALGMIQSESAVSALVTALADTEPSVREQAAWALGMIQSKSAVSGLVAALSDAEADVREQAAWALGMIGDPGAIDALSSALKDADADVREQAAWALGQIAGHGDDKNQARSQAWDEIFASPFGGFSKNPVSAASFF